MIFASWQSYERDVVPADAGAVQREETRRAFYAGAWAAYLAVLNAAANDDEAAAERELEALATEIKDIVGDLAL